MGYLLLLFVTFLSFALSCIPFFSSFRIHYNEWHTVNKKGKLYVLKFEGRNYRVERLYFLYRRNRLREERRKERERKKKYVKDDIKRFHRKSLMFVRHTQH